MDPPLLIADSSTLLNFLSVGRFDLILALGYRVGIVDAVYEEIRSARSEIDALLEKNKIRMLSFEGISYVNRLASLINRGLDTGEAFTVAAAIECEAIVAMDDRRAIKKSREESPGLLVLTSPDIVVGCIRSGYITVEAADHMKTEWSVNHRFNLKFQSFKDLLS